MKRASLVLVGVAVLLLSLVFTASWAQALTINSARDCDANAVINCGALNFTELQTRYQNTGVAAIYSHFGISSQDINNISNTAVEGVVTKNNNVWIHKSSGLCLDVDTSALSNPNQQAVQNNPNLCLVATDAMTAGRQNISGSTAVTSGGTTFYTRSPSVSFVSGSLPAFVVMDTNHRFAFAIIASCGNPVIATPTAAVTPKKTPAAPAPIRPTQTPTQTQTQTQTVVVNTQPAVQAATTTQPTAVTKTLPNTGPGNILALSGTTTAIGTIGHFIYSRRNRRS